jgi:hypothetical protein
VITFSQATTGDAYELQLREEDRAEVSSDWRQNLAQAVVDGHAQAARDRQGRLVALFGLRLDDRFAVPWLLCSPLVEQHGATAWRTAKRFIRGQVLPAQRAGYLVANRIPRSSIANRRFVEALGFQISPTADPAWDVFTLNPTTINHV